MSKTYRPRRQSARWLDADCPKGVLAIYDNPAFADRFTVIYAEPVTGSDYCNMWLGYRGMSEYPFHPQGVGMYGEMTAPNAAAFRYRERHRAAKWSSLPPDVRRCVLQDLQSGEA